MVNYYHLTPRYTCGSPGVVWDYKTAQEVAEQEKRAYQHALSGVYGEPSQEEAKKLGLDGIVVAKRNSNNKWHCKDVITGRQYLRIQKEARALKVSDLLIHEGQAMQVSERHNARSGEVILKVGGEHLVLSPYERVVVEAPMEREW